MAAEGTPRETGSRGMAGRFGGISLVTLLFGLGDMISGGSTFAWGETVMFNRLTGTTWDALQAADPGADDPLVRDSNESGAFTLTVLDSVQALVFQNPRLDLFELPLLVVLNLSRGVRPPDPIFGDPPTPMLR